MVIRLSRGFLALVLCAFVLVCSFRDGTVLVQVGAMIKIDIIIGQTCRLIVVLIDLHHLPGQLSVKPVSHGLEG